MNMKPPEVLSLLEEASGTKLYERKKEAAMKTLAKKQTKLEEIDEVGEGRGHVMVCAVLCCAALVFGAMLRLRGACC